MIRKARHTGSIVTIVALLIWAFMGLTPVSAQTPSPESAGEAGAPINAVCPVTTDEEIDPRFTAEYQGRVIGFCCKKCRRKFEEDPEGYVANLPQFQSVALTQADPDHDPAGHEAEPDHEHGDADHADAEPAEASHDDASHEHAGETAEHDHTTDHDDPSRARIFTWLGKFHPPATDLPIAMLIGAAIAEGLFIVSKREMFRGAAAFCVLLAAVGVVVAVPLGWFNAGFTLADKDWVQTTHRWLGTSTGLLTLVTLGLLIKASNSDQPSARLKYRAALFATTGLVGVTGFFGGSLVYGINHYAW